MCGSSAAWSYGRSGSWNGISLSPPGRLSHGDYAFVKIALGCGYFGGIGSAPAFFGQGESREEAFAIMYAAWGLGLRWLATAAAYAGGRSERWIGDWTRATGSRPRITSK